MNKFVLGFLLALSASSIAVTDNPDGSITLTREEAQNMLENFLQMQSDREMAKVVFAKMQNEIDSLRKANKSMVCT